MITLLPVLVSAALAAEPASYPVAATMELPEAAILRLDLGADWLTRCPDPSTYLLLDADGAELPFAARSSDESGAWRREALRWAPQRSDHGARWEVQPPSSGEPVHALRLARLPRGGVLELTVRTVDAKDPPDRAVLWNLPDSGAQASLELPLSPANAQGPWEVRARWSEGAGWIRAGTDLGFEAVIAQPWTVEQARLDVVPEAGVPGSATVSEHLIRLPRAGLPLRGVEIETDEPLFHRPFTVHGGEDPDHLRKLGGGTFQRVELLDRPVDQIVADLRAEAPAEIVLRMDDGRSAPLAMSAVHLALRGQALVVPMVRPGRYTLYGCGPEAPGYDLERLEARLAEQTPLRIAAPRPGPNEAWVPASAGGGLLAPGPTLDRQGYRWERPISGPSGLVRVPLDDGLLAQTRDGQPDLRFVDSAGHQLPYLRRVEPAGRVLAPRAVAREERGATSAITVTLPEDGQPLAALVLESEQGIFSREIDVRQAGGRVESVLARARWEGEEGGRNRLVLPIGQRVADPLLIYIDNGDNPPLELAGVTLVAPSVSAWLALPADGATAIYGHASTPAPSYDLALLRDRVLTQPVEAASMGAPQALEPPPAEPPKRALLLGLVAVMAALLLGLIVRLLKSPEEPTA